METALKLIKILSVICSALMAVVEPFEYEKELGLKPYMKTRAH